LSGPPSDRPCLVDFANLITKRLSLLECVNVVDDNHDWKKVEAVKGEGVDWLRANHVKAFYSVSRHASFVDGARISMELSGLGKLRPNMLLVGFKENWQTEPQGSIL
jgi:solute carrier family 12 sodium/potassium/chloride transporter 2